MTSRYSYSPEKLLGSDGKLSAFNCIYAASKILKGKGLTIQSLNKAMDALKGLAQCTGMQGMGPLVFVPVFDRDLAESATGLADIAEYYNCPVLDVAMYYVYLDELEMDGFLTPENDRAWSPMKRKYRVNTDFMEAILKRKEVKRKFESEKQRRVDQFDFCHIVSSMADARKKEKLDTQELLGKILQLEESFKSLDPIKTLRAKGIDLDNRVVFYIICNDYTFGRLHETDLTELLETVFDSPGDYLSIRSSILQLENPLMKEEWVEGTGESGVKLTNKGLTLFMGDMAKSFIKPVDGLDCYGFASAVNRIYTEADEDRPGFSEELKRKMFHLEFSNPQLAFVEKMEKDYEDLNRFLFYMVCYECMEDDSFDLGDLSCIYPKARAVREAHKFKAGEHPLQKGKLVECSKQGFFDKSTLKLTDNGKRLFFGEDAGNFIEKAGGRDLILPDKIVERKLFFEEELKEQLNLLQNSLEEEHYSVLRKSLEEKGMQKGIAVLLYGHPGTGKTESVHQIAKTTGRAIYHVDISATKSCWFGESEKLIKDVFKKYEDLCNNSEICPILLFNEADGIFSKRKDTDSSNVAQTENTIQNIILEEMERLGGILIATTNMADNLDSAFERRFLFKIKFEKPGLEARKRIWLSKLPSLSDANAQLLAKEFPFSGGEIDNIVRKITIMEVLNEREAGMQEIRGLCREEKMHSNNNRIGFC